MLQDVVRYASAFSDEETDTVEENEVASERSSTPGSGKSSPVVEPEAESQPEQQQPVDVRTTSESSEESPGDTVQPESVAMTTDEGESVEVPVDIAAEELALPTSEERFNTPQNGPRANFYFYQGRIPLIF